MTGTHGAQTHRGNAMARRRFYPFDFDPSGGANRTSLPEPVDAARYPVATSDIVSLLTLDHQIGMTNLLLRVGHAAGSSATTAKQENRTTPGAPDDALLDELQR